MNTTLSTNENNSDSQKSECQENQEKARLQVIENTVKLFIGGVPPRMKNSELKEIYLQEMRKFDDYPKYSEMVYCSCHNGFAFIVVSNIQENKMRELIKDVEMVYQGRKLDVRIAVDRKTSQENILINRNCKLLIHGLNEKISHDHLEKYFSQFGNVDKAYVSYCPNTGRNKGFGFVTFFSEEAANMVLDMKFHIIEGVHVKAKKNILKSEQNEYKRNLNKQNNLNNPQYNSCYNYDVQQQGYQGQYNQPMHQEYYQQEQVPYGHYQVNNYHSYNYYNNDVYYSNNVQTGYEYQGYYDCNNNWSEYNEGYYNQNYYPNEQYYGMHYQGDQHNNWSQGGYY